MKQIVQKLIFCGSCLLLVSLAFAQEPRVFVDTYRSQKTWRNRQGGGEPVLVDTVTALPELLQRLSNNWQFVETGKGYWIGYTDDMYSIAAHGEVAVAPLLALAQHSPSSNARIGAVYSLHLIGIESQEVGRYTEKFKSLVARQALRSLLTDTLVGITAIKLLIRDPWQSDVPLVFEVLKQGGPNDWALVNSLQRYALPNLPLQQSIPEDIGNEPLHIPPYQWKLGATASQLQVRSILQEIKKLHPKQVTMENGIEELPISVHVVFDKNMTLNGRKGLIVKDFLYEATEVDYLGIGSKIFYFVEGQEVTICGASTARKRALTWWQNQVPAYLQRFTDNHASKDASPFHHFR